MIAQIFIPFPIPMDFSDTTPAPTWLTILAITLLAIVFLVLLCISVCAIYEFFILPHRKRKLAEQIKDKLLNLAERAPTGKERDVINSISECLYSIRRGDNDIALEELEQLNNVIKDAEAEVRMTYRD